MTSISPSSQSVGRAPSAARSSSVAPAGRVTLKGAVSASAPSPKTSTATDPSSGKSPSAKATASARVAKRGSGKGTIHAGSVTAKSPLRA